ncbi:unnamed protein product [Caenorhabditis bovis]|uniref:G-protein coupled receptors family 1 profile domain-containing protein n=1 Tax=Caenorhabditis bovis TaxID=2654633 RepID=A0A8S1F2N9_9PELO|nr:unnamed protein product [Caenorhabditis bovis]
MDEYWALPMVRESEDPLNPNVIFVVEGVQLMFWCITVPFYTILVVFLVDAQKRRHAGLNTPFFKLCISTAIIDLVTMMNNYFGAMFPKWGYFVLFYVHAGRIYGHTYMYLAWVSVACQAMCVSDLAANRFSDIVLPRRYPNMFWYRRIWIPIAIQYVPGSLLGILTFFNPVRLTRNSLNGIVPKFTVKPLTKLFYTIGAAVITLNCLFLFVIYLYLFKSLRARKKKQKYNIKKRYQFIGYVFHNCGGPTNYRANYYVQIIAVLFAIYRSILFNS